MSKWLYTGEQELIVPDTIEGTKVVSDGDVVSLPDSADAEFEARGDFQRLTEGQQAPEQPAPAVSQPIIPAPVSPVVEEAPQPQEAAEPPTEQTA